MNTGGETGASGDSGSTSFHNHYANIYSREMRERSKGSGKGNCGSGVSLRQ